VGLDSGPPLPVIIITYKANQLAKQTIGKLSFPNSHSL